MMPTTLAPPATHLAGMLQTLMAADRFRTFIAAVAAAGVSRDLSRGGLTVFAPSDYAFERLPVETLTSLFTDRNRLRVFLAAHVVRGEYAERDLIPFTRLPTLAGGEVTLTVGRDDREILVDGVGIVTTDIVTSGGVVHELDGVLG